MRHVSFRLLGAGSALALASSLVFFGVAAAQTTTSNCSYVRFVIANPQPGDQIVPGPYQINGLAYDIRASGGTGISDVSLFLGNRDQGGTNLGSPVYPQANSAAFRLTTTLPTNLQGPTSIYGYATSAVDGKQYVVAVPFFLTNSPGNSTGGQAMALPPLCGAGQTPAGQGTPVPGTPVPSTAVAPAVTIVAPPSGVTIANGPYVMSGTAFDPAASSGSGIDSVQVFLGNRDAGGINLGSAKLGSPGPNGWTVTVDLPTNNGGPQTLFAYALSSVTGKTGVASANLIIGCSSPGARC
jgi:Bacterial Ig domain